VCEPPNNALLPLPAGIETHAPFTVETHVPALQVLVQWLNAVDPAGLV